MIAGLNEDFKAAQSPTGSSTLDDAQIQGETSALETSNNDSISSILDGDLETFDGDAILVDSAQDTYAQRCLKYTLEDGAIPTLCVINGLCYWPKCISCCPND